VADLESWAKHQAEAAVGTAAPAAPATPPAAAPGSAAAASTATAAAAAAKTAPTTPPPAVVASQTAPAAAPVVQAGYVSFPRDQMPPNTVPQTPLPAGLNFDDSLLDKGDPANGAKLVISNGGCLACHAIKGNPMMIGNIGPNLTHIATRTTIGAGLFPNDPRHLARWIKNAREMKPGVIMNTIGTGQYDPVLKQTMKSGLSDQQIADIVAYLQTLK